MAEFVQKPTKVLFANIIKKNHLNVGDFLPKDTHLTYRLDYKDSGIYFTFHMNPRNYAQFVCSYSTYSPSRTTSADNSQYLTDFDACQKFDKWIREHVIKYIEAQNTPDPWEEIKNAYSKIDHRHDDAPLNEAQAEILTERLDQLPQNLIELFKIEVERQQEFRIDLLNEIKQLKQKIEAKENKGFIRKALWGILFEMAGKYLVSEIPFGEIVSRVAQLIGETLNIQPPQMLLP